jgi:hypothetical protein
MKTKDSGRYGPWDPLPGPRRLAEAIQTPTAVTQSRIGQTRAYKAAVRNPSKVNAAQMQRARVARQRGLVKGSSPETPDNA